jgi:hypothetical protein
MQARAKGTGAILNKCNRKVCSQILTFVQVLNACASIVAIEEGRHAQEQIIISGWESMCF